MSQAVFMEYMGFKSTTEGREYAFHVRFSPQDARDYTVTIASEAFTSRCVSYQDGPNFCSSRLKREIIANPDVPTGTSFLIDKNEIDDQKALTAETQKRPYAMRESSKREGGS
jgi:hypothetical protein